MALHPRLFVSLSQGLEFLDSRLFTSVTTDEILGRHENHK